jgi:hypothetical protein
MICIVITVIICNKCIKLIYTGVGSVKILHFHNVVSFKIKL